MKSVSNRIHVGACALALICAGVSSCYKPEKGVKKDEKKAAASLSGGELDKIAASRGLSDADLYAAARTYLPGGQRDELVGLIGSGSSGRVAVFGIPSMKILKYIAVFTAEPWQGFAYDDESKAILEGSAREDIEYEFGDSGTPVFSKTAGKDNGKAAFISDSANGRIAVIDLADYETKAVVTNPVFKNALADLSITNDSEFVLQASSAPELRSGSWADPSAVGFDEKLRGAITFWQTEEKEHELHVAAARSFSAELPPYLQSQVVGGRGKSASKVFVLSACSSTYRPGTEHDCTSEASSLQVLDWKTLAQAQQGKKFDSSKPSVVTLSEQKESLKQFELPSFAESIALSPDGSTLAVVLPKQKSVVFASADALSSPAANGKKDRFELPMADFPQSGEVKLDGTPVSASFAGDGNLYITTSAPAKLLRVSASSKKVIDSRALDFENVKVFVPGEDTAAPNAKFAIIASKQPHGRFVSVGPTQGLNPQLVDIASKEMPTLYEMAVPQATWLGFAVQDPANIKAVINYKIGTNSRTSKPSPFATIPGQEHIERDGNRVHVFGTLIRSHITPDHIEVNQGDIVTIHLTNLEQAQDQTHGFTVDTYNVHGSWEPGKVASVTFTADRVGAFPIYCTEFCSALHLEMQGYLMVKPKGWKPSKQEAKSATAVDAGAKTAFEAKQKAIKDTQAVIDSVVEWLKNHDYSKDPRAASAVNDAFEQLGKTKEIQAKIDAAVKAQDWSNALLWSEQYFQYQVKCADAGLRAKKILSEAGGAK